MPPRPSDAPSSGSALRQLLERFATQQVLVIGDVMLDEYVTGDCATRKEPAPSARTAIATDRSVRRVMSVPP